MATTYRSFGVSVRSIDAEKRSVDVVASTDSIDSYGEIVEQDWDLSRYNRNPVVLYNHNSWVSTNAPEHTLPIGHAEGTRVEAGQLVTTMHFVDEKANPLAEKVWQGFLQGSLRAVSVGFNPRNVTEEKRDGKAVLRLSDNELFEISVCPMGANPDAVAKSVADSHEKLRARAAIITTERAAPEAARETIAMKTPEQLQAELDALTAKHADIERQHTGTVAELSVANERISKLSADLETMTERATKAEGVIVEKEVDALVGKKIWPAQRDVFADLARADYPRFQKVVGSMPDLTLDKKIPSDPAEQTNTVASELASDSDHGTGLAAAISAKAATL